MQSALRISGTPGQLKENYYLYYFTSKNILKNEHIWMNSNNQKKPSSEDSASSSKIFFFFCLFRATPMAHGGSQGRGRIRATAASLCHSNSHSHTRSEPNL